MIFHSFKNQNERRTFGGSAFIEIQYCTQKSGTELKKIVNTSRHWIDNSLYIYFDDIDSFFVNYKKIFYGGTYQNLHSGEVDIFGINYYSSVLIVLGDFYSPQGNWCFVTAVYLPLLSVYR